MLNNIKIAFGQVLGRELLALDLSFPPSLAEREGGKEGGKGAPTSPGEKEGGGEGGGKKGRRSFRSRPLAMFRMQTLI